MRTLANLIYPQVVTVDVAVIHEHGYIDGLIFAGGGRVVDGHGAVIDAAHSHRDGCRCSSALAIGDGITERIGAGEIGVRGVRYRCAAIDRYTAVAALGNGRDAQCVAIHVAVVDQHRDGYRAIFSGRNIVINRNRHIVYRVHRNRHLRGCTAAFAVRNAVIKRIRTIEIGRGNILHNITADLR